METTREEIKRLKESIDFHSLVYKNTKRRMDVKDYEKKIAEQDAIIFKAEKQKRKITELYNKAPNELKETKRLLNFKKKRLAYLENLKLIERLKKTVTELTKLSKEVTNENDTNS